MKSTINFTIALRSIITDIRVSLNGGKKCNEKVQMLKIATNCRYSTYNGTVVILIIKLKDKANFMKWKIGKRKEHFCICSSDPLSEGKKKMLRDEGVEAVELADLLK